jgi:hypothetical protein
MDIEDLSEDLAVIQVCFRVLVFLQPDQQWGWNHPVLEAWMKERNILSPACLSSEQLRAVSSSLKKAMSSALVERARNAALSATTQG